MKGSILNLFFLGLYLIGFGQSKQIEVLGPQQIDCSLKAFHYNVSRMVQKCEYIPLDNKAVFSLGRFFKFKVDGDYVLVQGNRGLHGELLCVLLFSKDGKFLAEMGQMGNQPGEYMEVTAFVVDTLEKEVLIVDQRLKRNSWFDFSGKFLRMTPAYRTVPLLGEISFWKERRLVGAQNISINKKMAYFLTDRNFSHFDTLGQYKVGWHSGVISFSCHPLSCHGNHCLMVYPFCDTIYEYTGKQVLPRYVTTVHASLPKNYKVAEDADYMDLKGELKQQGFIQKVDLFETQKYLWVIYEGGDRIIYDKTTRKGFFNKREFQDHPTVITPLDFMGQSGEALVSVLSAGELLQMKEDYAKRGVSVQGELKTLLERIKPGDNPVMLFYYFK